MKTEIKAIQDRQSEKYAEIDGILFESNQKVRSCLILKDELVNLDAEQRKLSEFVHRYNADTIEENATIRNMLAESQDMLQK